MIETSAFSAAFCTSNVTRSVSSAPVTHAANQRRPAASVSTSSGDAGCRSSGAGRASCTVSSGLRPIVVLRRCAILLPSFLLLDDLTRQGPVIGGAQAAAVILDDRLAERRRLGEPDVLADLRLENKVAEPRSQLLHHLLAVSRPAVDTTRQDARNGKPRIQPL